LSKNVTLYFLNKTNILCFYFLYIYPLLFLTEHIGISNEILEHFYLEVLKTTNTPFEIERRHNETEVLAWNHIKCSEYYVDIGLMEKYCQTE